MSNDSESSKHSSSVDSARQDAGERDSVVDAIFDTTLGWVDVGLDRARATLSNGARKLIRTAKKLEVVRDRLRA